MPFQKDKFGHEAYKYDPKTDVLVERSPDKQPSHSDLHIEDRGADVVLALEVKGLGALVIRGKTFPHHGVSIFTDDDIQFDK